MSGITAAVFRHFYLCHGTQGALDEQQRTLEAIRAEMGVKLSDGMGKMAKEQQELHTSQVGIGRVWCVL